MLFYRLSWFFFFFGFFGWCFEVIYSAIRRRRFVNRGFLCGPICPIYGIGLAAVYLLLNGIRDRWLLLYLASAAVTTGIELAVGFLMDVIFHHKWWDYSDRKWNIGGYVCLPFSLVWGLCCMFAVKLLFPLLEALIDRIPPGIGLPLLILFFLLLLADAVLSFTSAAGLSMNILALGKLGEGLTHGSDMIGESLFRGTVKVYDGTEKIRKEYNLLLARSAAAAERLLDAFPTMSSPRYNAQIRALKRSLTAGRKKRTERAHSVRLIYIGADPKERDFMMNTKNKIRNEMSFLPPGSAAYAGPAGRYVSFTEKNQLLNRKTWADFVELFRHDCDDADNGWRCEYWGKMMRGACLVYLYDRNEALYATLEHTVRDLLTAQREDGRFSTYSAEHQLHGWDIWGRKYVLTGMLHFLRINRDPDLGGEIIEAMKRHLDALIGKIGPASEGKTEITEASDHWLGVNSASILDAVVEFYTLTGEKKYLDFASYIIGTGGIRGEENLIDLALAGEKMPYEYPEVKAYETMSFFEGVLSYYRVTGEEKYFTAAKKFFDAVASTDITVIGCSGCTHELFDHSALTQTEWKEMQMQETCVTVTWMRVLTGLYLLTGEKKYAERIEHSALNALYGAVNEHRQPVLSWRGFTVDLPFDSYSPLYNNRRGHEIGGLKPYDIMEGYYGCCACIASAGIALYPLNAMFVKGNTVTVNFFLPGEEKLPLAEGEIFLRTETSYPKAQDTRFTLTTDGERALTFRFRVPEFVKNASLTVNGEAYDAKIFDGYLTAEGTFPSGTVLSLSGDYTLEEVKCNERTAFVYGPITLARDQQKEEGAPADLTEEIRLARDGRGAPVFRFAEPAEGEMLRLYVKREDGGELLLTDYASCGKYWAREDGNLVTVWMNLV